MSNQQHILNMPLYLTDGGMETTLVFHRGIDLNHFAAFELLNNEQGRQELKNYYQTYVDIATKNKLDFILEAPTWRANPDWGSLMGYTPERLSGINQDAIHFLRQFVRDQDHSADHFILSGCIGPRGDGYFPGSLMGVSEAKSYHMAQIQDFAYTDADLVTAMTISYGNEAVGIAKAARYFGIPVVISFTVETDGNLPSGETLAQAISMVDEQTSGYPTHFMINCAHPSHFIEVLRQAEGYWIKRIGGIRANASCKSHEELDNSETLDTGDKQQLTEGYQVSRDLLPNLKVIGGCCGTDHSHMEQIIEALFVNG
jgi:S-methylmethionine-dependent homocysteine/selenocysteine methylase